MTLTEIGDIGTATLSEKIATSPKTWETASDWDNAVSSTLVHEATGDLPGDSVLQLGYPATDRGGSNLVSYYSMDDSSGPIVDHAGGFDATPNNSPSFDTAGIAGTTSIEFHDNNDEFAEIGNYSAQDGDGAHTIVTWFYSLDDTNNTDIINRWGDSGESERAYLLMLYEGGIRAHCSNGSGSTTAIDSNTSIAGGTWYMVAQTYSDSNSRLRIYIDGAQDKEATGVESINPTSSITYIGTRDNGSGSNRSQTADARIEGLHFFDRELSSTEMSNLYNWATDGALTTATKTFATGVKPDFTNLDYTLNGESITLTAIGSPGTASEEQVSQSLGGATSYTLSWTNSHADFRVKIDISSSVPTSTPTFNSVTLD